MKIGLICSNTASAKDLESKIASLYEVADVMESDVIIVIGGDGEMLHAIHKYMHLSIPFFGINAGSVGFLMNDFDIGNCDQSCSLGGIKLEDHKTLINDQDSSSFIKNNLLSLEHAILHPIRMNGVDYLGNDFSAIAINEVSIFRKTNQAIKFSISVNKILRMQHLVSDGAMLASSAGSTAYNLSAGGPILPLSSNLLCLTPICPFRPRRWQGALLPVSSFVEFEILEQEKRPANAVADFYEFEHVQKLEIYSEQNINIKLLFDKNHNLEDKIIREQFSSYNIDNNID